MVKLIGVLVAVLLVCAACGQPPRPRSDPARDMLDTLVEAHYDGVPIDCDQKDLWVRAANALRNGAVQPPEESNCRSGAMTYNRDNEERFCQSPDPDDYCPPEGRP